VQENFGENQGIFEGIEAAPENREHAGIKRKASSESEENQSQ
jgi:hypothetical protein